jgi:hypothetical protein
MVISAIAFKIGNDWFDVYAPVNDTKVASFFTVVGSTATALTVFLLYRQIAIAAKGYQPKIKLNSYEYVNIGVYEQHNVKSLDPMPTINIENVGQETAFNVVLKWRVKSLEKGFIQKETQEAIPHVNKKASLPIPFVLKQILLNNVIGGRDTANFILEHEPKDESVHISTKEEYDMLITVSYEDEKGERFKRKFNCLVTLSYHRETILLPLKYKQGAGIFLTLTPRS